MGYVRRVTDRCGRREAASRAACAHLIWLRSRRCEIGAAGSVRRPRGGSGRAGGGLAVTHGHDGAGRSNGGAPYVPLRPRTRVGDRAYHKLQTVGDHIEIACPMCVMASVPECSYAFYNSIAWC